jgi:hypothetical protein
MTIEVKFLSEKLQTHLAEQKLPPSFKTKYLEQVYVYRVEELDGNLQYEDVNI